MTAFTDEDKKRLRQIRLEEFFAPLRQWCEERRRRYSQIAECMTVLREKPVTRQMVLRWFDKNPDKMREPCLSDASLLQHVIGELKKAEAQQPK